MKDEDLKEIISKARKNNERKFVRKIKKRIAELQMKRNKVNRNNVARGRYNFVIGELMFLIQE